MMTGPQQPDGAEGTLPSAESCGSQSHSYRLTQIWVAGGAEQEGGKAQAMTFDWCQEKKMNNDGRQKSAS
jgi:hypothetical protein